MLLNLDLRDREWEQNVYILRGTVADAPVKYIKRRKAEKNTDCLAIMLNVWCNEAICDGSSENKETQR